MKRLIAATVLTFGFMSSGCAHNNWVAPVVTGLAVGAVVAGVSQHYHHHRHHYHNPYVNQYYVNPPQVYVPQVNHYIQPPVIYRAPQLECHASFGYCYYR
jgi:hypothetical protein